MTTPNAMPKKLNPLGAQIVSDLLRGGVTTRKETRVKKTHPLKKVLVVGGIDGENYSVDSYTTSVVDVPVPTLAGNVSNDNVERIARAML